MPLNIRNPHTEALTAQLAKLTGETKTQAFTQALEERLARIRRSRSKGGLANDLDEIALHCAALPLLNPRSDAQLFGYDEQGTPR